MKSPGADPRRLDELERENRRLRDLLTANGIDPNPAPFVPGTRPMRVFRNGY